MPTSQKKIIKRHAFSVEMAWGRTHKIPKPVAPPFQTATPAAATVHMTVLPVLRSAAGEDGRTWSATGQRLPVHQRVRHEDH